MRVSDALGQITLIHQHLARGEVYRGFHPLGVALSGMLGFAAGLAQSWFVVADDPQRFVRYWVLTAIVCGFAGAFAPLVAYLQRDDVFARRRTLHVAAQFAPCVAVGFIITYCLPRLDVDFVRLLPGLWALLFGLGVFATRPLLPRAIGWVGLAYLACGALLLANPFPDLNRAGITVGGLFAIGQLATAAVLHRNLERENV